MTVSDISQITFNKTEFTSEEEFIIPIPKSEPTIGVIDNLFDTKVYFNGWLDYHEELNEVENFTVREDHDFHETSVSSLIVDGPNVC